MLFFHNYLWVASQVLLCLCALLLVRKRLHKRIPMFLTYAVIDSAFFFITAAASFLLQRRLISLNFFQWTMVFGTGVLAIFEMAVFYELADKLLLSRSSVSSLLRASLRWAGAVLLLVAAFTSALLGQPGIRRAVAAFASLDLSANILELGLLLVLLVFSRTLQISWRSLPAGIALGLGVSASTEIAAAALMLSARQSHYLAIDSLRLLGFHICVLIWLIYIPLPNVCASSHRGSPLRITDLNLWNEQMCKIRR